MAFFGVTVETIEKVWKHPNADKLDLAKCENLGFQFVVGKGQHKPGDKVLYFPIDSMLNPELKITLGIDKNPSPRVKTVKLRGEISQGMVTDLIKMNSRFGLSFETMSPEEITALLGVTKYDPPVEITTSGLLSELPEGQGKYDIEGCERYQNIVDILMSNTCVITEKLEGTNISVTKLNGKIYVNQRNNTIIPIEGEENTYWKVAKESGVYDFVKHHVADWVVVYGELIGPKIQSNIYRLDKHEFRVFDLRINGKFLSHIDFSNQIEGTELKSAPVISFDRTLSEFLGDKTIDQASHGLSTLFNTNREGIVIKSLEEMEIFGFGRAMLKQRSTEYLANEK